eukprot:28435-Amorphochlora_amoeboformis.AAC.1
MVRVRVRVWDQIMRLDRTIQHVLVRGLLTLPHCGAMRLGLRLTSGSDYSACLSPGTIDSSTLWGYRCCLGSQQIVLCVVVVVRTSDTGSERSLMSHLWI